MMISNGIALPFQPAQRPPPQGLFSLMNVLSWEEREEMYKWRINGKQAKGAVWEGDVWSWPTLEPYFHWRTDLDLGDPCLRCCDS